jgi:death-on-curing protein
MTDPKWVSVQVALSIHSAQLAEHGGADGVRDLGLLESAMARPQHLASFGAPTLYELAASYGFGIARNHPFADGNKRTAFVVCLLFLAKNGLDVTATDADCIRVFWALAAGELTEAELAGWIMAHVSPRD